MLRGSATTRRWTSERARDYYGGMALIVLGLGAGLQSLHYELGTLIDMGAGFFPAALGCLLALLGLTIALGASRATELVGPEPFVAEWRGWFCIVASVVAFIIVGAHLGLLPATFAIVFISALGDRRNTVTTAALLASAVSLVCTVVFAWALRVQMPLLSWSWS